MENKPNIIYIFSDQHRGDSMGCVGHPAVITPNMDRLASQGVTFTKCCTNSPLCMPARASMMTGKYVGEHGVWTNDLEAPSSSQSHVRNIRDAGYHTAVIGKTHLYTHGVNHWSHTQDQEHILKDWGFEYIHELTGPIATFWHGSPYTDYLKENGLLEKHKEYMGNYIKQWSKGTTRSWDLPPPPLPPEMHLDSYTGQKAVEWIDAHDGNKPFYLQIMFPGPHDPFDSPQHYRDMYHIDNIPKGILEFPRKPIPMHIKMLLAWSGLKDMSPEDCQRLRLNYYAKITLIDEYIGKILDAVEKKGLSNNTWIIYNSDHGEMLGDHMMRHKIVFYEGAFKIPLIVKPPGNYSGWQSKALTDHIDIAATLVDIAGAKPLKGSDGSSFLQKILNKSNHPLANEGKANIFSEVYGLSMLYDGRYKLEINTLTKKPVELYDLESDPDELINQVENSEYSSIRNSLFDTLEKNLLSHTDYKKLEKIEFDSTAKKLEIKN